MMTSTPTSVLPTKMPIPRIHIINPSISFPAKGSPMYHFFESPPPPTYASAPLSAPRPRRTRVWNAISSLIPFMLLLLLSSALLRGALVLPPGGKDGVACASAHEISLSLDVASPAPSPVVRARALLPPFLASTSSSLSSPPASPPASESKTYTRRTLSLSFAPPPWSAISISRERDVASLNIPSPSSPSGLQAGVRVVRKVARQLGLKGRGAGRKDSREKEVQVSKF